MKNALIVMTMLISTGGFASERLVCGTENQWPEKNKSGWFLDINLETNVAYVVKAESAEVTRMFDYKVENIYNTEFILNSPYGDEINMIAAEDNVFFAHHTNNGKKEEFTLTCFDGVGVLQVKNSELKLNPKLELNKRMKEVLEEYSYKEFVWQTTSKKLPPFNILAQKLKYSISDIGDWEETILTPEQKEKIYKTFEGNADFQELNKSIARDLKADSRLKLLGVLFARDWYSSSGFVGFAFKYGSHVFVVPFAFEGDAVFNDPRLDYVY